MCHVSPLPVLSFVSDDLTQIIREEDEQLTGAVPSALQALRCQERHPDTAAETLLSKEIVLQVSLCAANQPCEGNMISSLCYTQSALGHCQGSPRRSLVHSQMWTLLQGKGNGVHKV